jgi:protein SCO1/2
LSRAAPGRGASHDEIASFILAIREEPSRRDELLPLLREEAGIYAGMGSGQAERLRGFILASFAHTGLPEAALPFVIEELETGSHPYAVAGAAHALRSEEGCSKEIVALLERALRRLGNFDQFVDFDRLAPSGTSGRTALAELTEVLAAIRPTGCCAQPRSAPAEGLPAGAWEELRDVELQDQDGTLLSFGQLFAGRAGVLTFFYTRCMNPRKCSLTVSKLARIGGRIEASGREAAATVAGITYDPDFDLPDRLRTYGAERGMRFADHCRLLRTTGSFEMLRDQLSLGVGYGEATVNRHRLDLIVIRPDGTLGEHRQRLLWDEDDAMAGLAAALETRGEPCLPERSAAS